MAGGESIQTGRPQRRFAHVAWRVFANGQQREFLSFLREIDKAVPTELDVHCIVDNHVSHVRPKVKAWLAARPRWHMLFIPTYSSWLNQVERFFALVTGKAIGCLQRTHET
jgi:transposase